MLLGFQFPLTNKQWIKIITVIGILISVISAIYVKTHQAFLLSEGFPSNSPSYRDFRTTTFHLGTDYPSRVSVIPGGLTCVVGHALFGPLWGFVYNFTGIFLGSIFAFLLARRYGETFL